MSTTPTSPGQSNEATREVKQAGDEARRLGREAAETIERRGREQLSEAQRRAADRVEDVADAIDSGAEELESDGGSDFSGYGHSMATLMRRLAGGLRENDIEAFASDLSSYARRSPGVFLAGSVALGFGLSRFLKASSERSHDLDQRYELDYDDDDYERVDQDYDFDTALEPAPSPEVSRRAAGEAWPTDTKDPGAPGQTSAEAPSTEVPGAAAPGAGQSGAGGPAHTEGEYSAAATGVSIEDRDVPERRTTTEGGDTHG